MVRRGHDVTLFTSRSKDYRTWEDALPAFEWRGGVRIRRFRSLTRTPRLWRLMERGYEGLRNGSREAWHEKMIWLGSGPLMPQMAWALRQHATDFDLIHINNLHYSHAALAAWAARRADRPYVVTPHIHPEQPNTYDVPYMHDVLADAAAVFAVTEAERAFIQEKSLSQFVSVSGNALDPADFPLEDRTQARAQFGLSEQRFVPLFLGRKTAYKGLESCVEATLALQRGGHDVTLLAIGPETEESAALWQRTPPSAGLVVRGHVTDAERRMALAACDVLLLPSEGEAFGIVYLEAWRYGKPIIGGDLASARSFITDGQEGFLVPPRDVEALQARLLWLMRHPHEARAMGAAGERLLHRRFTVERVGDIVEATYRRILRHQAP